MPESIDQNITNHGMERTPYSTDTFRVRCPHCRKLYLVQFNDIQEAKPRFECVQCHSRFWLSLPDSDLNNELTGIPLQVKEVPQKTSVLKKETEPCPKCFKPVALNAVECNHCGVMMSKARLGVDFVETIPPRSGTLESSWRKVMADYGDEQAHTDFIRMSQNERNLPYAAAQYGQMQKLMPTDEITQRRISEIKHMAEVMLPPRNEKKPGYMYPRLWQVPLLGATILIIVGMVLPMFRNIVGLGAAFLFLGIAMQLQLRKK